jgi:hypothetical protein
MEPLKVEDLMVGNIRPTRLEEATERGYLVRDDLMPELLACQ